MSSQQSASPHTEQDTSQRIQRSGQRNLSRDVALVATFAAIIVACALTPAIAVAGVPAPITLQTFGVMLAGLVLGARRGGLAVLLYLAIGAAGLPVFSGGNSGLAPFVGATAGYLIAFPVAAFAIGWATRKLLATRAIVEQAQPETARRLAPFHTATTIAVCLLISLLTIHALGIVGMHLRVPMPLQDALVADLIFIPGDIIKTTTAVLVSLAVLRAFPVLRTLR
ncbi:biotin transporter BioY [Jonesia quinghaiensis]|uniref:biotin transporter BioY n=1 Tax=Jonesia quinghaiensis TaxID=262806 RepID=UPI0003FB7175|nr:biotin transporter BioY [Jonesia quinghaiensis]